MSKRGRPAKPIGDKSIRVTITLAPELVKKAKRYSKGKEGGLSGLVTKALEHEMGK